MNLRPNEQKQNRPISIETSTQYELKFGALWNFIMWCAFVLEPEGRPSSLFFGLYCLGYVILYCKFDTLFNFRAESVITHDHKSEEKPDTTRKRIVIDESSHIKLIQVCWKLGEEKNYHHLNKMHTLFNRLKIQNKPYLKAPDYYSVLNKILPYRTRNCDMPSKSRIFQLFFAPGYVAGRSISKFFNFSPTSQFVFKIAYTAASWTISLRESYLLREINNRYNLAGFSYQYSKYLAFPPTCLGQQMTWKIIPNLDNALLHETILYFYQGENLIKEIKSNPSAMLALDSTTRDMIDKFEFLVEEPSMQVIKYI
jgi:hypothetical protein